MKSVQINTRAAIIAGAVDFDIYLNVIVQLVFFKNWIAVFKKLENM